MAATTWLERNIRGTKAPVDFDDRHLVTEVLRRDAHVALSANSSLAVHETVRFAYGSAAGVVYQWLARRVRRPAVALFAIMWLGEVVGLRALRLAPMPWKWKPDVLVSSLAQHAVYAGVTSLVADALGDAS